MFDRIFENKWFIVDLSKIQHSDPSVSQAPSLGGKDSIWNLIYTINYMFDLNDIFSGCFLA